MAGETGGQQVADFPASCLLPGLLNCCLPSTAPAPPCSSSADHGHRARAAARAAGHPQERRVRGGAAAARAVHPAHDPGGSAGALLEAACAFARLPSLMLVRQAAVIAEDVQCCPSTTPVCCLRFAGAVQRGHAGGRQGAALLHPARLARRVCAPPLQAADRRGERLLVLPAPRGRAGRSWLAGKLRAPAALRRPASSRHRHPAPLSCTGSRGLGRGHGGPQVPAAARHLLLPALRPPRGPRAGGRLGHVLLRAAAVLPALRGRGRGRGAGQRGCATGGPALWPCRALCSWCMQALHTIAVTPALPSPSHCLPQRATACRWTT